MAENKFIQVSKSKQTIKGQELKFTMLKTSDKDGLTIAEAQQGIKDLLNNSNFPENHELMISSLSQIGWRSIGGWGSVENIKLYNPSEAYEQQLKDTPKIYGIFITFKKKQTAGGKDDKNNDCLYNCLKKVLRPLPWKYPSGLKKFLKIDRSAKVDIKHISTLEKKLTVKINVNGDCSYISSLNYPRCINLKLSNGHYENIINYDSPLITKGYKRKTRELLIYKPDGQYFLIYDGIQIKKVDDEFIFKGRKNFRTNNYHMVQISNKQDIKEYYNKYKEECEELILEKIHILQHPSVKRLALYNLFWDLNIVETETITRQEEHYLEMASNGGFINCKPGTYKNIKCFDINSMYPNLMIKNSVQFPIKQGEFKKLDELPSDYLRYGIYRCKCVSDIDRNLFKINPFNYYTHFDIQRGQKLGYKFQLIQDEEANSLIYNRYSLMSGKQLFRNYINKHYEIKKKYPKNSIAKKLLNIVWGALCEKTIFKTKNINDNFEIHNIKNIYPKDEDICFEYRKTKLFKTEFARLGVFLTSVGRKIISEIVEPISENVYRIHTDGFICDESINLETSQEMGRLKIEYEAEKVEIHNVNKIIKH